MMNKEMGSKFAELLTQPPLLTLQMSYVGHLRTDLPLQLQQLVIRLRDNAKTYIDGETRTQKKIEFD